ncbi:nuclease [Rhodobacterales bacterium HKCCE3408]|nr:nuclease [Rhodobacterales bacterium HKCCE3408]
MALNNAWANATLYEALGQMPDDAFAAEYPSFFGSIPATLDHILMVDLYYMDAMKGAGKGRSVFEKDDLTALADLAPAQAGADMALASFCRDLTPETLNAAITIDRRDGPTTEVVAPTLLHLFQHQIHHRGQVHGMMSQAGHAPPQLDDFFLDFGRVPSAQAYWTEETAW